MAGPELSAEKKPWQFRHGYKGGRDETFAQYERFIYYLSLGAGRRQMQVAAHFDVSNTTIAKAVKAFNWVGRAQAWDDSQPSAEQIPELLAAAAEHGRVFDRFSTPEEEAAAVAVVPVAAPPPERLVSRAVRIERLRNYSEQVGERHMACSLEMTGSIQLMQMQLHRLLTRWADETEERGFGDVLVSSQLVAETVSKLSRSIASMAAGSAQLATVGAERWGAALGIDVVMGQLQDFLKRQQQQAAAHPAPQGPGPVGQEVPP